MEDGGKPDLPATEAAGAALTPLGWISNHWPWWVVYYGTRSMTSAPYVGLPYLCCCVLQAALKYAELMDRANAKGETDTVLTEQVGELGKQAYAHVHCLC